MMKGQCEFSLTNSIDQNESTSEPNQTQEHQLLSNTLHSLLSSPNAKFSSFQLLCSILLGVEPMKTQLMSQSPVYENIYY